MCIRDRSRIYPTREVEKFVRNVLPGLTRGPLEDALRRATKAERTSIGEALRRLRELLAQSKFRTPSKSDRG